MKLPNLRKPASLATLLLSLNAALLLVSCNDTGSGHMPAGYQPGNDNQLLGAGSTFDEPLFSKMFDEYGKTSGVKVFYQSVGSGAGVEAFTGRTADFGATDGFLNGKQDSALPAPALHIPITSGAVVICYNLPEVTDTIRFTPDVTAGIFLGNIKKWNDPKIQAINTSLHLPDKDILVAHRADGSGTTAIFTDYLDKTNDEWHQKIGKGFSVNWPVGLGGKGNETVSGIIKLNPGAIGYVELSYALKGGMPVHDSLPFAKVQNKSGMFITPGIASITAAANVPIPADAKVMLTNTEAPDGYPISGFSWILIYKEQKYGDRSKAKASAMAKLIRWMLHDGQQLSAAAYYAPLSAHAVSVGDSLMNQVTYDGKPL